MLSTGVVRGLLAGALLAGAAAAASPDRLEQEADAVQRDLRDRAAEVDRISRREDSALQALETAARNLDRQRREARACREELEELDRRIGAIRAAEADLLLRIQAGRRYLSGRLVALYKAERLEEGDGPDFALSIHEAVKRKAALRRILERDREALEALRDHEAELARLQAELSERRSRQLALSADYDRRLAAVSRERSGRERALQRLQGDKASQLAAIESLQEAARELDRQIQALGSASAPRAVTAAPGRPLAEMKGLLIFPVDGKIVSVFGPYRDPRSKTPAFRNGIEIAAERGEPVRTVHAGRVAYAGWFRGYGNVLIIDHGDHYHSVYAHLEETFKSVDNRVEAGEVVATAGDSGPMGGSGLYFELRHRDRAVDPLAWLRPD
jgi:septal ring factor EnvC (AmiA/AmiB activator)